MGPVTPGHCLRAVLWLLLAGAVLLQWGSLPSSLQAQQFANDPTADSGPELELEPETLGVAPESREAAGNGHTSGSTANQNGALLHTTMHTTLAAPQAAGPAKTASAGAVDRVRITPQKGPSRAARQLQPPVSALGSTDARVVWIRERWRPRVANRFLHVCKDWVQVADAWQRSTSAVSGWNEPNCSNVLAYTCWPKGGERACSGCGDRLVSLPGFAGLADRVAPADI